MKKITLIMLAIFIAVPVYASYDYIEPVIDVSKVLYVNKTNGDYQQFRVEYDDATCFVTVALHPDTNYQHNLPASTSCIKK